MPTNETLGFSVTWNGSIRANASTDIIDKSYPITYSVGWYSDNTGTNAVSTTNEGDALFLVIKTQNVNNGTVINISLTGAGVTAGDFVKNALTFPMTVNNNIAVMDLTTVADAITEGNELVSATGNVGGSNVGSASVTIIDTSVKSENIAYMVFTPYNPQHTNEDWFGAAVFPIDANLTNYTGSSLDQKPIPFKFTNSSFMVDCLYTRLYKGGAHILTSFTITNETGTLPQYVLVTIDDDINNVHKFQLVANNFNWYELIESPTGLNLGTQIKNRLGDFNKMKLKFTDS